jgi:predicted ATP-dependent serine protease
VEVARYLCANCGSNRPYLEPQCGACRSRGCVYFAGVDAVRDVQAAAGDELPRRRVVKVPTGIASLDDLLADEWGEKGIVLGSTYVLWGPPGSRKTTIAGAVAQAVASSSGRRMALYVSSEQPGDQARTAAERLGPAPLVAYLGTDRDGQNFQHVGRELERVSPACVVYDSIQEFSSPVVYVVARGKRDAERMNHAAIFISQVNGRGLPEGPTRTIFRADTLLELGPEGAWIRCHKSRYGPTGRVALTWPAPPRRSRAKRPRLVEASSSESAASPIRPKARGRSSMPREKSPR